MYRDRISFRARFRYFILSKQAKLNFQVFNLVSNFKGYFIPLHLNLIPSQSLDRDSAQSSNKVELCRSEKVNLISKARKSVYSNKYV